MGSNMAEGWRRGSVVASWLLDLAAAALRYQLGGHEENAASAKAYD
jgi:6-phosphogluconate dehydrogenase (decarboxylating)